MYFSEVVDAIVYIFVQQSVNLFSAVIIEYIKIKSRKKKKIANKCSDDLRKTGKKINMLHHV